MFQIARVAVDKATWHYDKLYDYYLPVELEGKVQPGCRVTVPSRFPPWWMNPPC